MGGAADAEVGVAATAEDEGVPADDPRAGAGCKGGASDPVLLVSLNPRAIVLIKKVQVSTMCDHFVLN